MLLWTRSISSAEDRFLLGAAASAGTTRWSSHYCLVLACMISPRLSQPGLLAVLYSGSCSSHFLSHEATFSGTCMVGSTAWKGKTVTLLLNSECLSQHIRLVGCECEVLLSILIAQGHGQGQVNTLHTLQCTGALTRMEDTLAAAQQSAMVGLSPASQALSWIRSDRSPRPSSSRFIFSASKELRPLNTTGSCKVQVRRHMASPHLATASMHSLALATDQHVPEPGEEDGVVEVQALVHDGPLLQVLGVPAVISALVGQVSGDGVAAACDGRFTFSAGTLKIGQLEVFIAWLTCPRERSRRP